MKELVEEFDAFLDNSWTMVTLLVLSISVLVQAIIQHEVGYAAVYGFLTCFWLTQLMWKASR